MKSIPTGVTYAIWSSLGIVLISNQGGPGRQGAYCRMRPDPVTMVNSTNLEPERTPGLKPTL